MDDLCLPFLLGLFLLSLEESLLLSPCFFRVDLADRDRLLFVLGDEDRDRGVFEVVFFFFNEALVRPLCDEFFDDWLDGVFFDFCFG